MNRIRKINNVYQVLHTPALQLEPHMELIAGNWEDPHLKGFYVKEFDSLADAQMEAFSQADIDWNKLVSMHADFYSYIVNQIKTVLDQHKFIYEIDERLMKPEELKHITFDRVINFGGRYTLTYNMNDIVNIVITNPWSKNLKEMAVILNNTPDLHIKKINVFDDVVVRLIGITPLGTTYEIKLWPTIIHNWAKWQQVNNETNMKHMKQLYNKTLKLQNTIDSDIRIR